MYDEIFNSHEFWLFFNGYFELQMGPIKELSGLYLFTDLSQFEP